MVRFEAVVAFLEALPVTKGIRQGETMKLLPYQVELVRSVYGVGGERPYSLAVQSIARGNGKSGLLAGLALCHLLGPESEPRGTAGHARDGLTVALEVDRDHLAAVHVREPQAVVVPARTLGEAQPIDQENGLGLHRGRR